MIQILKIFLVIAMYVVSQNISYSQPDRAFQKKKEQIKAQKIAFITSQLNLTPQEAEKFWPVYNESEVKKEEIKKEFMKSEEIEDIDIEKLTDEEATKIADDQIIMAQRLLDLQKEYHIKYKSILPIKKIVKLYQAEKEFRHVLLQRIREQDRDRRF
jgi:hypothetical protein